MNDLFVHQLKDIYYAEQQLTQVLPKMAAKATASELKQGIEAHLAETRNQVKRLEQIFKAMGEDVLAVDCPAIDGIIKEAHQEAGDIADKSVLDAAIVANAQAVEHYEIARYGTLISWAKQLGRADCVALLEQTLAEEKAADQKLTAMAESKINRRAA